MPKAMIIYDGHIYFYDTITKRVKVSRLDDVPFKFVNITDCPDEAVLRLMNNLADMTQEYLREGVLMAYANNRKAARPASNFQTAGGTIIKLRHPYLSGQISGALPIDEVDVSRALKLNTTFLNATPLQDNSIIEPLVDGSTITITNHLMAGTMTLQALRTTGLVGSGDFIAAAHLIIASKDTTGSTVTVIEMVDEKRLVTIFFGVSFKNVPHLIKAGNAVVEYPVVMNYAGWVQGVSAAEFTEKAIWAVGNKVGLSGKYKPYAIQNGESGENYYSGSPLSSSLGGGGAGNGDEDNIFDDAGKADGEYVGVDGLTEIPDSLSVASSEP